MSIADSIKQSQFRTEHQKLMVNILYTANWLDNIVKKLLGNFGITHIQFNILRILAGASPEPLSAGDIKKVMVFSNSDITRLIDRLEKKELVVRVICPDNRRKMDITISDKGKALLDKINPEIAEIIKEVFVDKIGEEDALRVNVVLDLLRS